MSLRPMFCWSLLILQTQGKIPRYKFVPYFTPFAGNCGHFKIYCNTSFYSIRKPKLPGLTYGATASQEMQ